MTQCQPAVLSWATLPVSAGEALPEAQWPKDHLHLESRPYLPPWSCTQLPRHRCCCWQQRTPLPHTLSHGCKREDRDTMWTPQVLNWARSPPPCLRLSSQLSGKTVFRGTLFHGSRVLYWDTHMSSFLPEAGDNQLLLCSTSDACSAVNMDTILHWLVTLFKPFLFNCQTGSCDHLLVSRNSLLTGQCKHKININSFISVICQRGTQYLNPTEQSDCLLLFEHMQGAHPCPQKNGCRKGWVQYQAGVAEGNHNGPCTSQQQSCGLAGQAKAGRTKGHVCPSRVPNSQGS